MQVSFLIALRYWRAKSGDRFGRLVTTLATGGIILGVSALIIVLSVMNGLENYQKDRVLENIPHAIVLPKAEPAFLSPQAINHPPFDQLPPFVTKAVVINQVNAILQSAGALQPAKLLGVSQFSDDPLLSSIEQPFSQLLPAGQFNLVISSQLATQLQLNVGDKVRLILSQNSVYTPFGRVPQQRLFTLSAIYEDQGQSSANEVFANINDVGRLLRLKPQQLQGVRLVLDDPFKITQLSHYFSTDKWQIEDWRQQKGEFFQAVRMEKNMMGLLVSLIIIVAISNIVTSLSLMVVDKQGEIAILQTQGMTKRQIIQIFIYQGMLVGVSGTFIGGLLGVVLTNYLDLFIGIFNPNGLSLPTFIEPFQIGLILSLSLLFSLCSTIYPAYRAAKVEPAEALRYE
ncbi:lipoprotein-releasing system transmembrane subunit LolC [Mergibacter septicus]|uniref:lipoprotein-releasing ABC transporter permease subunit n=1 Tax=Mergibacter septicus TaxID=221402 RepID=UPI001C74A44E|nr:lipoprotein-releasing ABC transporter permease subunit [Mergibacter septicus]QDJ12644.1 lipoprotein-releasing system transmembrane subunit LolC [Mergibacter septicus]